LFNALAVGENITNIDTFADIKCAGVAIVISVLRQLISSYDEVFVKTEFYNRFVIHCIFTPLLPQTISRTKQRLVLIRSSENDLNITIDSSNLASQGFLPR
jgi:hypothetical protein